MPVDESNPDRQVLDVHTLRVVARRYAARADTEAERVRHGGCHKEVHAMQAALLTALANDLLTEAILVQHARAFGEVGRG